jgi:hypothetical protein
MPCPYGVAVPTLNVLKVSKALHLWGTRGSRFFAIVVG